MSEQIKQFVGGILCYLAGRMRCHENKWKDFKGKPLTEHKKVLEEKLKRLLERCIQVQPLHNSDITIVMMDLLDFFADPNPKEYTLSTKVLPWLAQIFTQKYPEAVSSVLKKKAERDEFQQKVRKKIVDGLVHFTGIDEYDEALNDVIRTVRTSVKNKPELLSEFKNYLIFYRPLNESLKEFELDKVENNALWSYLNESIEMNPDHAISIFNKLAESLMTVNSGERRKIIQML